MKFRVIVQPDEDGVFVAECPTLPGCISQGATRQEALTNIQDAIGAYLASLKKHGEPAPLPITKEVVEVAALSRQPVCSGADAVRAFRRLGYEVGTQLPAVLIRMAKMSREGGRSGAKEKMEIP